MSAYVVDRDHIRYLVQAVSQWEISWYFDGEHHTANTYSERNTLGQMLWDENVKSVSHRYPDDPFDLPGRIGDAPYLYREDLPLVGNIDPVQLIKACHCYQYQSCEHEEWGSSEACAVIESIINTACHKLPGYEKAEWGYPATLRRGATKKAG